MASAGNFGRAVRNFSGVLAFRARPYVCRLARSYLIFIEGCLLTGPAVGVEPALTPSARCGNRDRETAQERSSRQRPHALEGLLERLFQGFDGRRQTL